MTIDSYSPKNSFAWDNKKKGAKIDGVCTDYGVLCGHLVHADAEVEVEPVGGREHQEAEREDQPRHLVHRHRGPPPPGKVIGTRGLQSQHLH